MAYFPIFIELEGKRVLIAGGGKVAYRKARVLREYGAVLTVIAPELDGEFQTWALKQGAGVTVLCRPVRLTDADPADLVICATNDRKLQRALSRYARDQKTPVNTVDEVEDCSFLFPAVARRGSIVTGITTGGECPVASHYLKTEIQKLLTAALERAVAIAGAERKKIKEQYPDQKQRQELFREQFYRELEREDGGEADRSR